ncbi:DoxX family protein [Pedobacter frigoris]|uniref:DoxX family protein n=1 Tax=Pedobacter frigoris TaxID=2571272 RepID=A0A4U1CE37_9SPHI|nr:DoxX family protein [Pedobacter frigoris]TKC04388.1 DoxX family protein [Pedobacter frigoris]
MDYSLLIFIQIIIGLFFSILFLQSGLDKVLNYRDNKSYIDSVFEKTFLKSFSPLLFIGILLLETAAGILCSTGSIYYLLTQESIMLVIGLQLSVISLVCLFLGQRIAKDYAGAAGLVPYLILGVFGIYLFGQAG